MPGILGITFLPGDPPGFRAETFARMCDRLRGPHDRLDVRETPRYAVAVARLDTDTGPDRVRDGPDGIAAWAGPRPPPSPSEPSALWNAFDRSLCLTSDHYGFHLVGFAVREDRLLFSSVARALFPAWGGPPGLDDGAASDLVCFGHLLGDRTLVRGLGLVPPATVLTWREGRATLQRKLSPEYREDGGGPSGPLAVRGMADRLEAAVRRVSGEGVGVLLSGGLDSRAVAASAASAHPARAFTFGEPGTDDIRIAGQVARHLGLEHDVFQIGPDDLPRHATEIIRRTDGALNIHHACAVGAFDAIRDRSGAVLSGAQMLGSFLPSRLKPAESVLPFLIPPLPREVRARVLTEPFFETTEYAIPESMAAVEAACPFRSPVNRLDALDLAHRQRRFILAGILPLRDRVDVRLPLFDEDLMGFVRDVAPTLRANQRLYVAAFCHLYPDLARFPWAKTGLPVDAGPLRLLLARLVHRARGNPPRPSLARTGTWHARSASLRGFERDLLLGSTARARGLFRPEAVEALLSAQEDGDGDNWDLIGRMATLELWCRALSADC